MLQLVHNVHTAILFIVTGIFAIFALRYLNIIITAGFINGAMQSLIQILFQSMEPLLFLQLEG